MSEDATERRHKTYSAFFPFYLSQHQDPVCRKLHFAGTGVELLSFAALIVTGNLWFLLTAFVGGYGFAWVGHFFFERNKPATFQYPLWSYIGDHHMAWLAVTGRLGEKMRSALAHDDYITN